MKHLFGQTNKMHFDPRKPMVIQTDASSFALCCVLMPVVYASKTMNSTKINYAHREKELLAVLFSCQRFHQVHLW